MTTFMFKIITLLSRTFTWLCQRAGIKKMWCSLPGSSGLRTFHLVLCLLSVPSVL